MSEVIYIAHVRLMDFEFNKGEWGLSDVAMNHNAARDCYLRLDAGERVTITPPLDATQRLRLGDAATTGGTMTICG